MFFETTIMGKTGWLGNDPETNHWRPPQQSVSHRGSLLKGVAVYRVLYQSILNAKWLEGQILVGKGAPATGYCKLENTVTPSWSTLGRASQRKWLKLESVHQESPRSDRFRKRATKPLLNQRQRQKHLTWAVEKKELHCCSVVQSPSFQMKVNFAFHLEIKVPESGGRVERHRIHVAWSQCEVSTVSDDLGRHVICWCWSTVFSEVHSQRSHLPGNFRALHASFCWQALWRCWFHFPAGLGTCTHCQRYQKLVQWWCYCAWLASKLAWPFVKRKMRDTRPNNADDLKAAIKETWASMPPQQCHKLITSMPHRIEAVIKAKGALPSIEYIYSLLTYFPEGQQFSKNVLFYWSYEVF